MVMTGIKSEMLDSQVETWNEAMAFIGENWIGPTGRLKCRWRLGRSAPLDVAGRLPREELTSSTPFIMSASIGSRCPSIVV
jgi:hypothetical protein